MAARAAALARSELHSTLVSTDFERYGPDGAAAVLETAAGAVAVVSPGPAGGRVTARLGSALAWALRRGAGALELFVEADPGDGLPGVLARQATLFELPITVRRIAEDSLVAVEAAPLGPIAEPPASARAFEDVLEDAGLDVVVEDGTIAGELRGLEVARVALDSSGAARLEVGVGRFDREAFTLLHPELSDEAALTSVVELIGGLRRRGAAPHPVNRLARERWLRHQLLRAPSLVGAGWLGAAEATRPRRSLRESGVAIAVGELAGGDGGPVVVAASVGLNPDVVPEAADARLWHSPAARLVIVVPPRDDHAVIGQLAAALRRPAQVVTLAGEWDEHG